MKKERASFIRLSRKTQNLLKKFNPEKSYEEIILELYYIMIDERS